MDKTEDRHHGTYNGPLQTAKVLNIHLKFRGSIIANLNSPNCGQNKIINVCLVCFIKKFHIKFLMMLKVSLVVV